MNLLFLPFILFENFIGSIASSLNIAPPPQIFTQLSNGQGQQYLPPPAPFEFIKGSATYTNEETWEWEDWRGRQRSITVHRNAKES